MEADVKDDMELTHDICIHILNRYLNYFEVSEKAMRKLPGAMTKKERTELVYYQEMVRNIKMVRDYIDNRTESVDWSSTYES